MIKIKAYRRICSKGTRDARLESQSLFCTFRSNIQTNVKIIKI